MAGSRFTMPYVFWITPDGEPIPGALLEFFVSGSAYSVHATTYSDPALTTPNSNPVVGDDTGAFPNIFLNAAVAYGAKLFYASDGINPPVQIWAADPINAEGLNDPANLEILASVVALQAATIGSTVAAVQTLGYYVLGDSPPVLRVRTNTSGPAPGLVQSADGAWWAYTAGVNGINIRQFGAKIDGATDDTAAWTNALSWANSHGEYAIYHPGGNSIFTGNMVLRNQTITGVDSYGQPPGAPITITSKITFRGHNAGMILADASSGAVTLEKVGFFGTPADGGQKGFFMDDALRPAGQNEGWPTFRDVLFQGFDFGIQVGAKYQGGWMFNVMIIDSVNCGYQNFSVDWYHYMLTCGSSIVTAASYQMELGSPSVTGFAAGSHQFHGGAFFNGQNTIIIQNSFGVVIEGAIIQNAIDTGLVIGDGVHGTGGHQILGCVFTGNNVGGGNRNANGHNAYDIWVRENTQETLINDNLFAWVGGLAGICVAAGVDFEGSNYPGVLVNDNVFNMDNIVTPGAPAAPRAITVSAAMLTNTLDLVSIDDNLAFYGQAGAYPFAVRSVNLASIANPYTTARQVSIRAGTAAITNATAQFLDDPDYAGRLLTVSGVNGSQVNANSAGAYGGGHSHATWTGAGAMILLSTGATTWQVVTSTNVTFT